MIPERIARLHQTLNVARRFGPELRPHRWWLVLIACVTLGAVSMELLRPWPIRWIIDSALTRVHPSDLSAGTIILWGALATLVIIVVDCGLDYVAAILTYQVGQAVSRALRLRLFDHLSQLSPGFHARFKTGDLLVRVMGDVPLVRGMLVDSSVAIVTRSVLVVGTISLMFWVDWRLTLSVLGAIPLFLVIVYVISKKLTVAARKQRAKEGVLADTIHEAIAATPVIQSLGRGRHVVGMFARENRRTARAELKASRLSARLAVSVESLFGLCTAVALLYGSYRVIETQGLGAGQFSTGSLVLYLAYVRSLLKPVRATSKHSERLAKGTASAERLLTILDEPIAIQSGTQSRRPAAIPQRLAFEDVHFRYAGDIEALRGFQAHFVRGELAGLFGRSGSGKSTVAALAVRLYDPDQGVVRLDGVPLPEHELGALRDSFGLAMQESVLFGESIRENLLLGRPDASEPDLWQALGEAGADAFVRALPEGLETELGSRGVGLSGGESRRLCLARTLLRHAPILIVDEPFSGLDKVAVDRVRATLVARARESIVIVIAHDLDNLDVFDRILFLEDGRVNDCGTHAELSLRSDAYRRSTRARASVTS